MAEFWHTTGSPEVVRLLLEYGANPNKPQLLISPFKIALTNVKSEPRLVEIIQALCDAGGDPMRPILGGGTIEMPANKPAAVQAMIECGFIPPDVK